MRRRPPLVAATLAALAGLTLLLDACSAPLQRQTAADRTKPPTLGACYRLDPEDVSRSSNASDPVSCRGPHTTETFATGTLPESVGDDHDSRELGRWVHPTCQSAYEKFLGVDESLALRVQLSWAWFRPSQRGWDKGARWYRCDLVGGPTGAATYADLPETGRAMFRAKPPEQWVTCARGASVQGGTKVPCSADHDWRAVTTIKLGDARDPYPGDRLVQVRSRDFCSDSVGAWMNYPVDYAYGYTWFHEAEWQAGNRRSVCWAKTDR